MPPYADFTWNEIMSQPHAWEQTLTAMRGAERELRALSRSGSYDRVVFTGCGSTYYLALAAAASFCEVAGVEAAGYPASEVWLNPRGVFPGDRRTLLVPVSRSGATTETIRAVETFRAAGRGPIATFTCYGDQPLAGMGDVNVVIEAGQEQSIAQTRAFSTLYLATLAFALFAADRADALESLAPLPSACANLLETGQASARERATDEALARCFFLGSGARYGLAAEISLKMKEMSLSDSEPFHFLEYRHGPQSMAQPGTLIVGFLSEANRSHEAAVLNEMRALGATVVALGTSPAEVALADLPDSIRGPLYLPWGQMLAYERAIWRGLNPDRPNQLAAVVKLDGES
ncbi:MAG TPA: SIS domain-containing protein [Roseiflexaceae bacterium]|nr:SIS domain-containing protein [Roseiflexaceae bacterium]